MPIAGAPWLLLLLGAILASLGLVGVVKPDRRVTAALSVIGAGMIVVPLALSLPQRLSDSRDVLKLGRVAVSQPAVTAAHSNALAVNAMVDEIDANMLPDLAQRLHTSVAGLDHTINRQFPGLATGLREWPAIAPAAFNLVAVQQASIPDLKKVEGIGYSGLEWLAIGPGIVLLLLGGAALWAGRARTKPS